jgi:hypothetical protein
VITVQKIIDEVNSLILEKYPENTFYIQDIPEGFERPSFFIEMVNNPSSDANKFTTEEEVSLQITYFAAVDDYYSSDMINKLAVCETVKTIFKKGFIVIGDQTIMITSLNSEPRGNEIFISTTLQYFEDRPLDTEEYEIANDLQIK